MKLYEIFVSVSYVTDGGSKEHNCFKGYVEANNENEAKRIFKSELKAEGYRDIKMDRPIAAE